MLDTAISPPQKKMVEFFKSTREKTELICSHLTPEDHVVQPIVDVSPPKWHLAHTTWFFESFLLTKTNELKYSVFNEDFSFLFNSYYESIGKRVLRTNRGNLTRPSVAEILHYRSYVDRAVIQLINSGALTEKEAEIIELGIQHEMQHQELLMTDIKYILGHNPVFPVYSPHTSVDKVRIIENKEYVRVEEGVYEVGFKGDGFHFDNEKGHHKVYLEEFEISSIVVKNGEFLDFINDQGYQKFKYWHSEGWNWVNQEKITSPLYWHKIDGTWFQYTLAGLKKVDPDDILMHISFYEASAYASWKGLRLPTEFEWEVASSKFNWGDCWEWTNSAYLAYPRFEVAEGAIGEYNGKFMINQMVLKGASRATAKNHSRKTYRNFFHPHLRWQFSGIRLAK